MKCMKDKKGNSRKLMKSYYIQCLLIAPSPSVTMKNLQRLQVKKTNL
jgi:hypothetical protein